MTTYFTTQDSDNRTLYHLAVSQGLIDLAPHEEFVLVATEDEIAEVSAFFGYTLPLFEGLRPKTQVGMIRDHRRQMDEKEFGSECIYVPDDMNDQEPTFGAALLLTFIILGAIVLAAFVFR